MPALLTRIVDRPELGLDLGDAVPARLEVGDVPLVDRDPGLLLELGRGLVIAAVVGRDLQPASWSATEIASPIPRVPPVTNATRAIATSPTYFAKPLLPLV